MGAWGAGPFENDDAADWVFDFDGADAATGQQLLRSALAAADGDPLDAPEGSVAVAAAQVVAWLVSPVDDGGEGAPALTWVQTAGATADPDLVGAARRALARVRSEGSELRDLWDDADDDEWSTTLGELDAILAAAAP